MFIPLDISNWNLLPSVAEYILILLSALTIYNESRTHRNNIKNVRELMLLYLMFLVISCMECTVYWITNYLVPNNIILSVGIPICYYLGLSFLLKYESKHLGQLLLFTNFAYVGFYFYFMDYLWSILYHTAYFIAFFCIENMINGSYRLRKK